MKSVIHSGSEKPFSFLPDKDINLLCKTRNYPNFDFFQRSHVERKSTHVNQRLNHD